MVRVSLSDLGFMDLLKAFVVWTIVALIITIIIIKLPKQLVASIDNNPLGSARAFAELFIVVVSPWMHPQLLAEAYELLGLPPQLFYILAGVVDSTLITMFGAALLSSLRLWLGILTLWRGGRSIANTIALAGSSIALAGPALALIGILIMMVTDVTPVVTQGMRIVLNPLFIFASIPLPWPLTYGTILWLVGVAVTGAALLIPAVRGLDIPTAVPVAVLIIGAAISLIGMALVGFLVMSIATGIIVIMNRGVEL
ncbi:hypothetical protein [Vulcanisaeta sp. JCM 14467]